MVWSGGVGWGLRVPLFTSFLLLLTITGAGAAYRLTFQNGTSIEVRAYEDLGDAIRYPRLGGTVVVPKSSVSTIEETVHLPPPTPPPPAPNVIVPPLLVPPPVRHEDRPVATSQPAPNATYSAPDLVRPWKRVGDTPIAAGIVRILTGIALVLAILAVSLGGWTAMQALGRGAARRQGGERILGEAEFLLAVREAAEEQLKRAEKMRRKWQDLAWLARQPTRRGTAPRRAE